jgi:hypothetical protein
VGTTKSLLRPLLALGAVVGALLGAAIPASAAPVTCTERGTNPRGIVVTHLFAKVDGNWVEPANVCVAPNVDERPAPGSRTSRQLTLAVWNTVDGGFPETHLPPGTPISVGLRLAPGMVVLSTVGRWRDAVVLSRGADTVIQAKTAPWDYHNEAYFGGGLDCTLEPVRWPSTFLGYSYLNGLEPDGTPSTNTVDLAGGAYSSNSIGPAFPRITVDGDGNAVGVEAFVSGCGDGDPATHEGYWDGFTPVSMFRSFGIDDAMLEDTALLQDIVEVRDLTTGAPIEASFSVVREGGLALEPIPGVEMPPPPTGAVLGVRTTSEFSYSSHRLVQRAQPAALRAIRRCRATGGVPKPAGGRLRCVPDRTRPRVKLVTGRSLRQGDRLVVRCNEPCRVKATLAAAGTKLARGTGKASAAGAVKVRMKLTAAGRHALATHRSVRGVMKLAVADRAGNATRVRRGIRLTR